jgi:hypothetical protein
MLDIRSQLVHRRPPAPLQVEPGSKVERSLNLFGLDGDIFNQLVNRGYC